MGISSLSGGWTIESAGSVATGIILWIIPWHINAICIPILGVSAGIGMGVSALRRGATSSRIAGACGLLFNISFLIVLIVGLLALCRS
jgi:hypothetical protein